VSITIVALHLFLENQTLIDLLAVPQGEVSITIVALHLFLENQVLIDVLAIPQGEVSITIVDTMDHLLGAFQR